jgi:Protein of unknown function (DUF1822)
MNELSFPNPPTENYLTIPLDASIHRIAQQYASVQPNPTKAIEVYRNILAVYAAHLYLQLIHIDTDLERSEGSNLATLTLTNTASLCLPEFGDLECILIDRTSQEINPSDSLGESICVLVVRSIKDIQDPTTIDEVEIFGFTDNLAEQPILVSDLKSIDYLFDYLEFIEIVKPSQKYFEDLTINEIKRKLEDIYRKSDDLDFEYNIAQELKQDSHKELSQVREEQKNVNVDRERLAADLAEKLQNLWGRLEDSE